MPTYQLGALSSDFERTFGERADACEDRKPGFTGVQQWLALGWPVWLGS